MRRLAPLRRGFQILDHLAAAPNGSTFSAIRASLPNVGDASLTRILSVLQDEGLVAKNGDGNGYRLGPAFLRIVRAAAGALPRAALLEPVLSRRASEMGHTLSYWEWEPAGMVVRCKSEIEESTAVMPVGGVNGRMTRHPCGQLCLAYQSRARAERLVSGSREPPAIPKRAFLARLTELRKARVFLDPGETGRLVTRIAGAVTHGADGPLVGVLLLSAPGRQYPAAEVKELMRRVREAADEMSRLVERHARAWD